MVTILKRSLLLTTLGFLYPNVLASTAATLTSGNSTRLTVEGIGSRKMSRGSLTADAAGRCYIHCMNTEGCVGFNLRRSTDHSHVSCDFKEGEHNAEDLVSMSEVQYVGPKVTARHCADLYNIYGYRKSGVYDVNIANQTEPANYVSVYCDMVTDGGKWMVLLRRQDGRVNFDRSWNDYMNQFGDIEGELWMGLEFMHNVTQGMGLCYELRVDMTSFPRKVDGQFTGPIERGYAKYRSFSVGSAESFYKLKVAGFTGNWGDSLSYHDGMMFSGNGTANDHDKSPIQCADLLAGPWWYNSCSVARLTGAYGRTIDDVAVYVNSTTSLIFHGGLIWATHLGYNEHLQYVEMKIRPR